MFKPRQILRLLPMGVLALMLAALCAAVLTQFMPLNPPPVVAAGDPVIAAAGDISCDVQDPGYNGGLGVTSRCRQKYTSDLLYHTGLSAVLPLGDNQYECGSLSGYQQVYNPTWGRVKSISYPVPGNHEYQTFTVTFGTDCTPANVNATGYYSYYGNRAGNASKGYYSYNIGTWHLIALNSNCTDVGGCGAASLQGIWLENDLSAHPNQCTLAYWHQPLFSSGGRASNAFTAFWATLYAHGADVVLNGHDHLYERFAQQAPDGSVDPNHGIREFVVGTGGGDHTPVVSLAANSQVVNDTTFGVLKLTLHATSYDWQFVPEAGATFTDSGTGTCNTQATRRLFLPLINR